MVLSGYAKHGGCWVLLGLADLWQITPKGVEEMGEAFTSGGARETPMDTDRACVILSARGMGRMDIQFPALLTSFY